MLYLPEKTSSSYSSKLLFASNYTETFTFKDLNIDELTAKGKEIAESKTKEGLIECASKFRAHTIRDQIDKSTFFTLEYNYEKRKIIVTYMNMTRCYCFNCKKFINTNVSSFETGQKDGIITFHDNVYICPHCGTSATHDVLKQLDTAYTLFNECFLDGNKLKLKKKTQTFREYNKHIFIDTKLQVLVSNLDTGMTYSLPYIINNKINKKSKLMNVTYDRHIIFFNDYDPKYSEKCKSKEEVLNKAFNLIREYKIKKNNFYIPTLEEQINFALNNGSTKFDIYNYEVKDQSEKYSYKTYMYGESYEERYKRFYFTDIKIDIKHILKFNRFPAVNLFIKTNLFDFQSTPDFNSKLYKKFKTYRGQIKQDCTDPYKELALKLNIPYSKALKKVYKKDIRHMITYNGLSKQNIKNDNILKMLNLCDAFSFNESFSLNELFIKCLPYLKENPTYNENNFINRLTNYLKVNDYHNYMHVEDTFRSFIRIKEHEDGKDYMPDFRLDIKSLHDRVSSDERKFRTRNRTIEYKEEQLNVNGTFNGLHFALAKDTHELIEVGSTMGICVGGYGNRAIDHSCYIVVAKNNNGEPIICIEIEDNFMLLKQTKLKYNARPIEGSEQYKAILEWCHHANMIPMNYEINSYNTTKQFILDHKDLVNNYNEATPFYKNINLSEITVNDTELDVFGNEVRPVQRNLEAV